MDQPQQAALEGPGGDTGLRESLPLHRFRHAPHPPIGTRLMNFGPDSDVIARIVNDHPMSRLDELLPWGYPAAQSLKAVA